MQTWVYPHRHQRQNKSKKWVVQLLRQGATASEYLYAPTEEKAEELRTEALKAAA